MPLRKSTGNMYPFVDYTWNPIKGRCFHDCLYCYMKRFPLPDPHLDEKELKTDLGQGNFIFVGSGIDMFADNIPSEWINKALTHCCKYQNRYLFQSKNPSRFIEFDIAFPSRSIFATTIESNRDWGCTISNAPDPHDRVIVFSSLQYPKILTVEPIMDFDLDEFVNMIEIVNPQFINIGADSKGRNLPEPPIYKVQSLIKKLRNRGYEVKLKSNLKRILGDNI